MESVFKEITEDGASTPLSAVSPSTVSIICSQPWSKNVRWKIPEINNSQVLNCEPF